MKPSHQYLPVILTSLTVWMVAGSLIANQAAYGQDRSSSRPNRLRFEPLPDLPDEIGVAGPIVGQLDIGMIVAGGANFARADDPQLWDLPKRYLDEIWILKENGDQWKWADVPSNRLSESVAYPAVVQTQLGILVMGGENTNGPVNRAFLLSASSAADSVPVIEDDMAIPDLPMRCTGCGAALIDDHVYLVAGQVDDGLTRKATRLVWRLDLKKIDPSRDQNDRSDLWERIPAWPAEGPERMFALVAAQHDGFRKRLFVIGGRKFAEGQPPSDATLRFGNDGWSFDPALYDAKRFDVANGSYNGPSPWKRISDTPVPLTAGTAVAIGPAHIIVPAYADGSVLQRFLESGKSMQEFDHPGFPKTAYAYHTITDTWADFGGLPVNQVTTPALAVDDSIFLFSGEARPRVRTRNCWKIDVVPARSDFGTLNLSIVIIYLMAMLGVGCFFTFRNRTTDDYFRGGMQIPWWAAACSIFATMLSSITYMAVPAKAFAQDWVYWVGNLMILGVAPIAIYIALPFFRRIDATSAYEYLELRFNRTMRLIGSGSFSLFHIFRMGVVLALAALALASITPLTPGQCVIVMGVLSIVYCTLGGIEAVIWTDTIQTLILIGGALLCLVFAWSGSDPGSFDAAVNAEKLKAVQLEFGPQSFTIMALWLVILGGAGQNLASYTADQAVIQRYMTTSDQRRAAKSIWMNAFMSVPAGAIFFALGSAFWMFYRSHPEKLDPTIAADRIMPFFISQELPMGLAGLVVAGIFAAAQSTVSTSMNSGATTLVTDFIRAFDLLKTERAYLWSARILTLLIGILGTITGLLFVDPAIKSLWDQFIGILGMFLGVLAGLFALGATTKRANETGSLFGAVVAIVTMTLIVLAANNKSLLGFHPKLLFDSIGTQIYLVHSYLYAFIGIAICYVVGYAASWLTPSKHDRNLSGLTLFTLDQPTSSNPPSRSNGNSG